jgi:hypothetical protein
MPFLAEGNSVIAINNWATHVVHFAKKQKYIKDVVLHYTHSAGNDGPVDWLANDIIIFWAGFFVDIDQKDTDALNAWRTLNKITLDPSKDVTLVPI